MVLTSSFASSGATVRDATLACSASMDFFKDSLTFNEEIDKDHFYVAFGYFSPSYNRNLPTP